MAEGGETVAMVLSGGVALGAYQAGACAALHDRGGPLPTWLAGSSIGAVNAAILAGNPPERRVEALRGFWEAAASADPATNLPLLWPAESGPWRHAFNWLGTLRARLVGRPGFFTPRPLPDLAREGSPSLYDLGPMRARLDEGLDFSQLNGGEVRVAVVTTDIETGEAVVFDTGRGDRLTPDHLLATCGFLPEFAPLDIDGRLLGDGGLAANAPVEIVLGDGSGDAPRLCFVIEVYPRDGNRPRSLEAAAERRLDLLFANPTHRSLEALGREHRLRAILAGLAARLPPEAQADPDLAAALAEGAHGATILHLSYRAPPHEAGPEKTFDFSRATLTDRWAAGALDMEAALRVLRDQPAPAPGFAVHPVRG